MMCVSVYVSIMLLLSAGESCCVFCILSAGKASCGICVSVSTVMWVLSAAREKESVRQSSRIRRTRMSAHLKAAVVDTVLR